MSGQIDPTRAFFVVLTPYWRNGTIREDMADCVAGATVSHATAISMAKAYAARYGGQCFVAKVKPVKTVAASSTPVDAGRDEGG